MRYIKVYQRTPEGKNIMTLEEDINETFNTVYFSYYGNESKTIKVYEIAPEVFEVYCKNGQVLDKVWTFLKMLGYNDYDNPIDTTPTSTHIVHINLGQKIATLIQSMSSIRDHEITWEDTNNHIYAYRDYSNYVANDIKVYFRNYKTAKRWLKALEYIGYAVTDTRARDK